LIPAGSVGGPPLEDPDTSIPPPGWTELSQHTALHSF
jgi:hypothetical protein